MEKLQQEADRIIELDIAGRGFFYRVGVVRSVSEQLGIGTWDARQLLQDWENRVADVRKEA